MTLRCVLDGLLLEAKVACGAVTAYDGEEGFGLEAVEALHYEIVAANPGELLRLERAYYRLLRRAEDFVLRTA